MYSSSNSNDMSISDSDSGSTSQFEFMLKLYCLRNWLVLCNNTFITGEGNGTPYTHINHHHTQEIKQRKLQKLVDDVKERVGKIVSRGKAKAKKMLKGIRGETPQQGGPTRRLLFGEIDTDSASSINSVLGGRTLSPHGSERFVPVEKDHWVKGLLWFYGVSSRFGSGVYVASSPSEKEKCGSGREKMCSVSLPSSNKFLMRGLTDS